MTSVSLAHIPKITRISNKIIRILGCNPGPMTLQGTNTYLIGTGKKRILIDAGSPDVSEYITNLNSEMAKENLEISDIIITHWHSDHIGGVKDILKHVANLGCSIWKYPRSDEESSYDFKIKWLKNNQQFQLDNNTLKIIHTPGHTTDHIVVHLLEDNAIFSGDCILGEGTAVFEDLHDYMLSLNSILNLKPSTIYPAHGSIVNDPVKKLEFYIRHRNEREKQILECLNKDISKIFTEMDIVEQIYTSTPKNLWKAAAINVSHHLTKLEKENKVKYIQNLGFKSNL